MWVVGSYVHQIGEYGVKPPILNAKVSSWDGQVIWCCPTPTHGPQWGHDLENGYSQQNVLAHIHSHYVIIIDLD